MAKNVEKQKLVVVESQGSLIELGGISGPIINPCLFPISSIIKMIHNHRKVFEVNPANTSERVRLTIKNVNLNNFPTVETTVKANVAPVVNTETKVEEVKTEEVKEVETKKEDNNQNKKNNKGDFTKK